MDKCICIKSMPSSYKHGIGFLKSKIYKYKKGINLIFNIEYFIIYNGLYSSEFKSDNDFNKHFICINEYRELRLNKILNE